MKSRVTGTERRCHGEWNGMRNLGIALLRTSTAARKMFPIRRDLRQTGLAAGLRSRAAMALRLRYEIDTPGRLRQHVHLVDGAGYFFFPDAVAPKGVPLCFWVNFTATEDAALLRGWVWARPPGGLWLELTGAELSLEKIEQSQQRLNPRVASGQLVLAEAQYRPAMLCRLRDVSLGGARLAAMPADAGTVGAR